MKRIIAAAAALAALSLASCSEGQADMDEQDRQNQEQTTEPVIDQEYCLDFFDGEFLGTRTDSVSGGYEAVSYENIVFTPFTAPKEVTGVSSFMADGEAVIVDWCVSESTSHAFDPLTFTCYYSITYDEPITMYFCEYDTETRLTTDSGVYVPSTILDETSFRMLAYWRSRIGNYFAYTRQ